MICNLRMRPRINQFHAVNRRPFSNATLFEWVAQIHRWFDENILSVSQATKSFFIVHFRLFKNSSFVKEQIIGMIVFTAKDDVKGILWGSESLTGITSFESYWKTANLTLMKFACRLAELRVLWWYSLMWGSRLSYHNLSLLLLKSGGSGNPPPSKNPSSSMDGLKFSFRTCFIDMFTKKPWDVDWSYFPEFARMFRYFSLPLLRQVHWTNKALSSISNCFSMEKNLNFLEKLQPN